MLSMSLLIVFMFCPLYPPLLGEAFGFLSDRSAARRRRRARAVSTAPAHRRAAAPTIEPRQAAPAPVHAVSAHGREAPAERVAAAAAS